MLTPEILHQLAQGPAIAAASSATADTTNHLLALPSNFTLHDLERLQEVRRRARGSMTTSAIDDFAEYLAQHAEEGSMVFVDAGKMAATAVLNLGTPQRPGHADNTAVFSASATAAYEALRGIADGRGKPQRAIAEFMEDWGPEHITCWHADEELPHKQAVAAVRRVTIESLSRSDSTLEQLSASRSTFDEIKATSGVWSLPTRLEFVCQPYKDLAGRRFSLRMAVITSGKEPELLLRIVKFEQHVEQMAAELVDLVSSALEGSVPTLAGQYRAHS